jgi:glycerol-3-phosphate acyltransferase PlsY
LSLQTPLIVVRWILVLIAVLVWLVVVPIIELVALAYRTLARAPIFRRHDDTLLTVSARSTEGPATRE